MTTGTVTTRWQDVATSRPDLAAAGEILLRTFTVGYLATVRGDGAPRVHPVTVTIHDGGLYVCTIAATRKSADLRRDGRYALHAFPRFPTETGWSDEEFMVGGRAVEITDAARRSGVLAVHNDTVADGDPLWELGIDRAFHKSRVDGQVRTTSWRRGKRP
jgi:nitroimidazol reductase NimA-like FMN-containing flavoprotein (pyridoxamine 5'-phosphate oxidase superfamily)